MTWLVLGVLVGGQLKWSIFWRAPDCALKNHHRLLAELAQWTCMESKRIQEYIKSLWIILMYSLILLGTRFLDEVWGDLLQKYPGQNCREHPQSLRWPVSLSPGQLIDYRCSWWLRLLSRSSLVSSPNGAAPSWPSMSLSASTCPSYSKLALCRRPYLCRSDKIGATNVCSD